MPVDYFPDTMRALRGGLSTPSRNWRLEHYRQLHSLQPRAKYTTSHCVGNHWVSLGHNIGGVPPQHRPSLTEQATEALLNWLWAPCESWLGGLNYLATEAVRAHTDDCEDAARDLDNMVPSLSHLLIPRLTILRT
jgi:hypothetical protein